MARAYRIVLAKTEGGLQTAAGHEWTILSSTVRPFQELDSNDDMSFNDPDNSLRLLVKENGFVALAYKDL